MNLSLLLLILPVLTFASSNDLIEVPEDHKRLKSPLEVTWTQFLVDKCEMFDTRNVDEERYRENGLRRCRDNSISYVQPKSTGAGGWEGKCGHTFGANTLFSLCAKSVKPDTYFNAHFRDITPGVRPKTLRGGIARVFDQNSDICPTDNNWTYFIQGNKSSFIQKIKELLIPNYSHRNMIEIQRDGANFFRNPVGALIQNPGGNYLHWVTITDVLSQENKCEFVVNHWDNQYHVDCELFANWSYNVGRSYPIILKSYSLVSIK